MQIIYGVLYLNFSAYPIVFQQEHGWNTGVGGLAFLGILVGTIVSVILSVWYVNPQYLKVAKAKGGRADPEDRLPPAIWGGVLIVIGLAGFAATDGPNVHWIAPIMFGIPFGTGVIIVFLAVLGYLVDSYLLFAASVLAANSVLRSLFGAAFPLFTNQMYVDFMRVARTLLIVLYQVQCFRSSLGSGFTCVHRCRLYPIHRPVLQIRSEDPRQMQILIRGAKHDESINGS